MAHVAAHDPATIVAHQQVHHAALRLRLKRQLPRLVLQGRPEQRGHGERLGQRALHEAAAAGTSRSLADRVPHDVRAAIPPSVRRGVRKALGRSRDSGAGDDQP